MPMLMQDFISHAVQLLQHLHKHQDAIQTESMLVKSLGISRTTFYRIANRLRRTGLLISGLDGNRGYALGKPVHEISFYEVFIAVEGEPRLRPSLRGAPGYTEMDNREIHKFLQAVQDNMIAEMSDKCIVDLA